MAVQEIGNSGQRRSNSGWQIEVIIQLGLSASQSEEDDDGSIKTDHVFISEAADSLAKLRSPHCRQLVDHEAARLVKAVLLTHFHEEPEERCLGGVGRERADGDRVSRVEPVILDDDNRLRLADVARPRCRGPDLATPHSSSAESASMKSWSSCAIGEDATSALCRWASATNWGARTSGTQIWTGRNPSARSRARCACTRVRTDEPWSVATPQSYM